MKRIPFILCAKASIQKLLDFLGLESTLTLQLGFGGFQTVFGRPWLRQILLEPRLAKCPVQVLQSGVLVLLRQVVKYH